MFRYTAPALSTNGVTGRPSEATAELGAKLVELTVDALVDLVERGRVEEPPLGRAPFPTSPPPPDPRPRHRSDHRPRGRMDTIFELDPAHTELATDLAARGVEYVVGSFIDINGRAKSKAVPVEHLPAAARRPRALHAPGHGRPRRR